MYGETLTLDEAAIVLRCSIATLEDHLRTGHIPGTKIGVPWVIPRDAFFARLNEIAMVEAAARRADHAPPVVPHRPPQPRSSGRNKLASM